jgi:hypothetical protein
MRKAKKSDKIERFIRPTFKEKPRPAGKLTKYEQETIIGYNREETHATLFTYQKSLINHMIKQGADIEYINIYGGHSFKFPKSWVRKPLVPQKERESK